VRRAAATCAVVLVVAAGACGPAGGGGGDDDGGDDDDVGVDAAASVDAPNSSGPLDVFDPEVVEVRIEIDYESGRAPYTGMIFGWGDSFDLARANIDRLFAGHKTVSLPTTLPFMQDIGVVSDDELTIDELLQLADAHRDTYDESPRVKTYYVLFVGGVYGEGGPQPGVLGVTLGDTGVVVMFKDVIAGTASVATPNLERYVEQSTLVHEIGHAVGLVRFGVPLTSSHHDDAHGAHCTNQDCVMYWLNEGASDMAQYTTRLVLARDSILFDAACLADVDALTGG
jgi:hypothetical protein